MPIDEGLSAEGQIEVTAKLNGFLEAAKEVQRLDESLGGVNKEVSRVADLMRPAEDAAKRLRDGMRDGGSAARTEAADFATLTNQLRDFIKVHRDAAQLGVVNSVAAGTVPDGTARARLEAMSTAELQKFIAIDNARGVNAVNVARQIVAAREREAAATETAVAASIKAVERESAAFTAAYTAELNTALRVDEEIAASQQARRYAVPQNASRNVASPVAFAAAQEEYAAQETRAFSAAMKEQDGVAKQSGQGITSLAYSLFNLSFMAGAASTALLAMDVATVKTAVDYQREFADVARTAGTTGAASDLLKQSLIDLSTTIPVSFEDITKIATLGGQLDIAASDLDNFTSTVAMFSATSNVATEAAATGLGRLGQLLPDVQGNYEALASSILKVGVNSVATESEIIAVSTQIAGIASTAGLSASEVIGLSGALASVGIQPELSRGLITRLFTNIQVAVAQSGQKLEDFGKISGKTGADFAAQWKSDPTGALLGLLTGIQNQGDGAIGALKALGIASVRDIPAIEKLAQSHQVLAKALNDGKTGYEQQTELTRQFGVIADTVASRLTVLQNHFKEMLNAAGSSATGPLIGVINGLDDLLKIITKIASSPVGQVFSLVTIGAVALTGAALALAAILAVGAAGFLLMASAAEKTNIAFLRGAAAANIFKAAMIGTGVGTLAVILGTVVTGVMALSGAFDSGKDEATQYFGSLDSLTTAMRADQKTYKDTGESIAQISTKVSTATVKAKEWVPGLHDAAKAQVELNDNTSETTGKIKAQTEAYGENSRAALRNMIANNPDVQKKFADPQFQSGLKKAGGNFTDFLTAVYGDPEHGADEYVSRLRAEVNKRLGGGGGIAGALKGVSIADQKEIFGALNGLGDVGSKVAKAISVAAQSVAFFDATADKAAGSTHNLADSTTDAAGHVVSLGQQIKDNIDQMYASVNAQFALQNSTEALGEAFINNGSAAASQGSELQQVIADIINTSVSDGDAANALQGFFNALVQGSKASSDQLSILQQVIASLALSSGKPVVATPFDMKPFIAGQTKAQESLKKTARAAADTRKEVRTLVDYANDLSGVFKRAFDIRFGPEAALDAVTSAEQDIANGFAEADAKVVELTASLAELQQENATAFSKAYADEFASTLKDNLTSAFAGAFARMAAADQITSSFRDLEKALADSRQQLVDLRAEIQGIASDRSIKEFQLKVAVNYGDNLRADALRSDLADLATKEAAANKSIADATAATSRVTDGNTDAAIKNRSELSNLVSQYQNYIGALIDTGASATEISAKVEESRQAFQEQGLSLGFTSDQLKDFGHVFDTFSTAVANAQIAANTAALKAQKDAQAAVEKAAKDLKAAQDDASRSLDGNSAAAIRNRNAIRDVVQKNEDYITALAASGVSQDVLKAKSAELRGEFVSQLTQAGLSQGGIDRYTTAFDDLTTSIGGVPRNITVAANANPALQALKEFNDKLEATRQNVANGIGSMGLNDSTGARQAAFEAVINARASYVQQLVRQGNFSGAQQASISLDDLRRRLRIGDFWSGGYVGDGDKYEPMGVVHGGEYVFTKEQTAAIGPQNLQTIAAMAFSHNMSKDSSVQAATASTLGSGIVQLSPYDRQLLADIRDNIGITIPGSALQHVISIGARNGSNRRVA